MPFEKKYKYFQKKKRNLEKKIKDIVNIFRFFWKNINPKTQENK